VKYDLPEELSVTVDGPVRAVTIDRAAELNCVNERLHWGLASRVVAPDELPGQARRLGERLAGQPEQALRGPKRIVNRYLSQVLGGPMQAGFAAEVATMQSSGHRDRVLAFHEKAKGR